ncbi:hypothetical protein Dimus_026723, partial [Dionaea muscipula]
LSMKNPAQPPFFAELKERYPAVRKAEHRSEGQSLELAEFRPNGRSLEMAELGYTCTIAELGPA